MVELTGKCAIVTGGGSGLGEATAKLMAARGARVMIADINAANAEQVCEEIRAAGGDAFATVFDLHDPQSIVAMTSAAESRFGGLDILFANAADLSPDIGAKDIDVEMMDVEVWDRIFRANVRGTMLCVKAALPVLKRRGGGAIVLTGSALSLRGNAAQAAYSSGKAALIQLARSVATSHGAANIRCNVVLPGLTLTDFVKRTVAKPFLDVVAGETLLPRLADPDDLAEAVVFFSSDRSAMITGQTLTIDGGESIHFPGVASIRAVIEAGHLNVD